MALLESEQKDLLVTLVEASRNVPPDQRQPFYVCGTEDTRDIVFHPGLAGGQTMAPEGDSLMLHRAGLVVFQKGFGSHLGSVEITPEGYEWYREFREEQGEQVEQAEDVVRRRLLSTEFQGKHKAAFDKWGEAESLLWSSDTTAQLTTIGHLCREALQLFADDLYKKITPTTEVRFEHTVQRIRAVLGTKPKTSERVSELADALVTYWDKASSLIQRQEHGLSKPDRPLVWEDGRRVVLHTALVMMEVHQIVGTGG